jgi:hypothetical protein
VGFAVTESITGGSLMTEETTTSMVAVMLARPPHMNPPLSARKTLMV